MELSRYIEQEIKAYDMNEKGAELIRTACKKANTKSQVDDIFEDSLFYSVEDFCRIHFKNEVN